MAAPLLVFDLDGTLADTAPDLMATLAAVLPRHGFAAGLDASFRNGIGHGARVLIEYALARQDIALGKAALDAIHADFLAHYEANIAVETRLFPGTLALLDRFAAAGWAFAVCTNKPVAMSRLLLDKLGVAGRFAAICGGDSFAHKKPDPAHLLDTIAAAKGRRGHAIMLGDSLTDLDTARAAKVPFVGVTFGYTPTAMAELGPDLLIDSFDAFDLPAAIRLAARTAGRARTPSAALP